LALKSAAPGDAEFTHLCLECRTLHPQTGYSGRYLTGFKNRVLVVAQWAWSYLTFGRGARLIVDKEWRFTGTDQPSDKKKQEAGVETFR